MICPGHLESQWWSLQEKDFFISYPAARGARKVRERPVLITHRLPQPPPNPVWCLLKIFVCMYCLCLSVCLSLCVWVWSVTCHSTHMEVRGQSWMFALTSRLVSGRVHLLFLAMHTYRRSLLSTSHLSIQTLEMPVCAMTPTFYMGSGTFTFRDILLAQQQVSYSLSLLLQLVLFLTV